MVSTNGSSTAHISGQKVNDLTATEVHFERSVARNVEADVAQLEHSAVQRLNARQATIGGKSSIGSARINQATLRQSSAGIVVANSVACDEVRTGILISPVVRGDVHTLLDIRSAIAVGVGIVLGRVILSAVRSAVRRIAG